MKRILILAGFIVILFSSNGIFAIEKTVKLEVRNFYCISCPYIVKSVLSSVNGVKKVVVSLFDRSATITFDDSKTNIDDLMKSIYNQGYPSRIYPEG